jgi:hypothetical protein
MTETFEIKPYGFSIGPDADNCVPFCRDGKQIPWEKTNRLPYTKDAMKALVLMVEYGVTSNLTHDDSDMTWYLEALDAVHAKYPLASYEFQKQYFITLSQKKKAEQY